MRRKLHARGAGRAERAVVVSTDRSIAAIAGRQHGVVARAQLLATGMDGSAIDRWVRAGRLHRLHRGVYLVGHTAMASGAREMAALLACGGNAVLSHRTAAGLWQLLPCPAKQRPVDVTVAGRYPCRRPGIRVHRVGALARRDVRVRDSLPITTPARTLLDLAAVVSPDELDRAFAEAQVRRLAGVREVADQIDRNPRRAGVRALRPLVEAGPAPTRSKAERLFLRLIRKGELPRPRVNAKFGPYEVDFLWPEHRLVVEIDGFGSHGNRRAFERDRERDAKLAAAGYTVLRVTWRQLLARPQAVLARLAAALAIREGTGPPVE